MRIKRFFRFSNYRTGVKALDSNADILRELYKKGIFNISIQFNNTLPIFKCSIHGKTYDATIGDYLGYISDTRVVFLNKLQVAEYNKNKWRMPND